jgi:hypothetical protein
MGTPTNSSTPLDLNREIWAVKSLDAVRVVTWVHDRIPVLGDNRRVAGLGVAPGIPVRIVRPQRSDLLAAQLQALGEQRDLRDDESVRFADARAAKPPSFSRSAGRSPCSRGG